MREKSDFKLIYKSRIANSYYGLLGLNPTASPLEIRRAYRQLSKLYHPDTTKLAPQLAKTKFQALTEAYATLSNPQRRSIYDLEIGYSRINVIQPPLDLNQPKAATDERYSSSAYLDPTDRPLSSGEIFALFMLGITLIGCLVLALVIAWLRGETSFT